MTAVGRDTSGGGRTVVVTVFLVAVSIAPLDVTLVASFTLHDALILLLGIVFVQSWVHAVPRTVAVAGYVYLLAALVSTFRATHPIEALTQALQFAFIFFVQLPLVLTVIRTRRLLLWSIAAFTAGSLVGVAASMAIGEVQGAQRAVAFFSENPNRLGYPAAYALPFVLLGMTELWHRGSRTLAIAVGGVLLYVALWALSASASRGAAAGAVVAFVVFVAWRSPGLAGRKLVRGVVAAAAVAGLAFAVSESRWFPTTLQERVEGSIQDDGTVTDHRLQLDAAGLRAFAASPLVGVGLDNFRHVAERYGGGSAQAPHNLWVQSLAQTGLVGTVAFAVLIGWWFVAVARAHREAPDPLLRATLAALIASFAAVVVIYMNTPLMIQRHYWLIYGFGLAGARLVEQPARRPPPSRREIIATAPTLRRGA